MNTNCFLCGFPFDDQDVKDSKEHIIPQSIGGRDKVTGFICISCNNGKGNEWDSKLATQLGYLSLLFKIKKERSKVPSLVLKTDAKNEYLVKEDGSINLTKPYFDDSKQLEGNRIEISIKAKDEKEAIAQIMRAKKKYPKLETEKFLEQVQMRDRYVDESFIYSTGQLNDEPCEKSIVKTAIAMAVKHGVPPEKCDYVKKYITGESDQYCFGYFYETDLILNRPQGVPLHCVFIKGDSNNGVLWAYIEYFSVHRGLVCLSTSYEGETFQEYYAINPKTAQKINNLEFSLLNISKERLINIIKDNKQSIEKIEEILHTIIPVQLSEDSENEYQRVLSKSINTAFRNCGAKEGEIIQEHHIDKLIDRLLEELNPWIKHNIKK
ncbi:HNH endonuclease [Acinetobacter sp. TSRC1-2]|uniref:HNH endonuclease n=1 Tax=unclassified Acinetobacter TaxID=196816 RepID=UPI003CF57E93